MRESKLHQKYSVIFFDADNTLFDFDDQAGLKKVFADHGKELTEREYIEYKNINRQLWQQYQRNEISAATVQCQRFEKWEKVLSKTAAEINIIFLDAMFEICQPLDGAEALLESLHGKVRMGIITNGFTHLQRKRLERSGFSRFIETLIVSEEVGVAKPHAKIFSYALEQFGHPEPHHVLMVGDTLDSDILGGNNAGLNTCWLTHQGAAVMSTQTQPTYQVSSLQHLEKLLHTTI